jgi:hypothetical protein
VCFRGKKKKKKKRGELIERDGEKEKKMGEILRKKSYDTCKRKKERR